VAKLDPPATFHILRHTYASSLAMKGVPMGVIAAQLGHADTRMTEKHYAHLAPSYVANTVRAALPGLGIIRETNVIALQPKAAGQILAREFQKVTLEETGGADQRKNIIGGYRLTRNRLPFEKCYGSEPRMTIVSNWPNLVEGLQVFECGLGFVRKFCSKARSQNFARKHNSRSLIPMLKPPKSGGSFRR
jgi:hypothetical protein